MEINFNGKRAVVTGASRGIGRHIAIQLAKCGAKVIALARNEDLLVSLKEEVPSIEYFSVDLSDWAATRSVLEKVGDVDLLVNNAGLAILEPLDQIIEDNVDKLIAINIKAVINITQFYCATKGAVDAFTRAAAKELGPFGIRINSINPTLVLTELGKLASSDPAKIKPLLERTPLQRIAEVGEVKDAVLLLLSDKSSMITATSIPIDGGYAST